MTKRDNFIKGKVTKVKLPTTGAWLTNVGKSLGMAAMDVVKEVMPATSEIAGNVSEYVTDFKDHISELKSQKNRLAQAMDRNVYMDIIRTAKNNAIKDFKDGKFYTPISYDDDMDDFDFGDDFDFDVGDDSDYDASFTSSNRSTSVSTSHSKDGDVDVNRVNVHVNMNKITDAINRQTQVSIDANNLAIEYDKAFNKNLLAELSSSNKTNSGLLSSIESNIGAIISTTETISKASSIAVKYYDDSMSIFKSINDNLIAIKESRVGNNSIIGDTKIYEGKYENVLDELFSSNGVLNLEAYSKLFSKQLKSAASNNLIISQLVNIASDTDTLQSMFKHPLNLITEGIIKKVIPTVVREAATSFDETLQESMITSLHRVRGLKNSTNPFLQFIGETFGIGNKLKTDVDKSNYNKGKVDWNGESHKTLNEVIPYYLRRIAAAVTGTEEMAFDYTSGKFDKLYNIQKKYKEDDDRVLLRELSGTISDMKTIISDNVTFRDADEEKKVNDELVNLMKKFVKTDGTSAKRVNGSFLKFVADTIANGNTGDVTAQLIAGALDALPNAQVMKLFGSDLINARNVYSRHKIQEESGETPTNNRYIDNGLGIGNEFLKESRKTKGTYTGTNYVKSPFIEHDKWGKSPNKYLRDIYSLLLNGIITFPQISVSKKGKIVSQPSLQGLNNITQIRSRLDNDYINGASDPENDIARDTIRTDEYLERHRQRGNVIVTSLNGNGDNLSGQLTEAQRQRILNEQTPGNSRDSWFNRITGINTDEPISKIINKFTTYLTKPGEIIVDFFKKSDDFLFKIVFGDLDKTNGSMFKTGMAYVRTQFTKFSTWINDKLLKPIEEKLFGEDGIFTKIKQTKFMGDVKAQWGKFTEFMLGTKSADGTRVGGLFSETANALGDVGREAKEFLVGKGPDSVLSNIKDTSRNIVDSALEQFGTSREDIKNKRNDPNYNPIKDAFIEIGDRFKLAGNMLVVSMFGASAVDGDVKKMANGLKKDVSEMGKGKIGAGAVLGAVGIPFLAAHSGLIGSFFLPGGPIGGALLGVGLTIAKNSDTIQNFLFGKISDEGIREGGVINKELSNAFMNNKQGLAVGAIGGLAASMGFIPSLFFPGGPIGGAMIGIATSMVFKSEAMQKFLFGDDTTDGIFSKVKSVFQNAKGIDDKGRFLDAGVGAGLGLVGSFFLPGGPILGALLGGAAGFAAGSEKVQTFLFGEEKDGKRTGGLITRLTKKVSDVIMPGIKAAQDRMLGFLERGIMIPFMAGMKPIISVGANMVKNLSSKVSNMFTVVGAGIKEFLFGDKSKGTYGILSPLMGVGKFVASAVTKVSRAIISAPFKLIAAIGKTIDLGTRIRNLLSPVIDLVIKPVLNITKIAIKKTVSLITKGITSIITAPFKLVMKTAKGAMWLLRKGGEWLGNTPIGKAFINGRARAKINNNENGGRTGLLGMIAEAGTKRYKWENGKIVIDKDYKYDPTQTGRTVARDMKAQLSESADWELFKLASRGDKQAIKKFNKKYGDKATELLDSGFDYSKDRAKFDKMLGHDTWWKQTTVAKAKDIKAEQERNAKYILAKDIKAYNITVEKLSMSKDTIQGLVQSLNNNKEYISKNNEEISTKTSQLSELKSKLQDLEKNGSQEEIDKLNNDIQSKITEIEDLNKKKIDLENEKSKIYKALDEQNTLLKELEKSKEFNENMLRFNADKLKNKAADTNKGKNWIDTIDRLVEGTTKDDVEQGNESRINVEGTRAFGGKIKKLGAYILSPGEEVIPNEDESTRVKNSLDEKELNKFINTNDDGQAVDRMTGTTINKSKDEERAEYEVTSSIGSVESRQKKWAIEDKLRAEELDRRESHTFRNKMLEAVEKIGEITANHSDLWSKIFGKAGLATLALLAICGKFPDLLEAILGKASDIVTTALTDTAFGVDSVGGVKGVINNTADQVNKILNVVAKDKDVTHIKVNEDGTVSLDENGKLTTYTTPNSESIAQRLYNYIFPEQTRIDVDGSETGIIGGAYTTEHNYDAASGAKLDVIRKRVLTPAAKFITKTDKHGVSRGSKILKGFKTVDSVAGKSVNKLITTATKSSDTIATKVGSKGYKNALVQHTDELATKFSNTYGHAAKASNVAEVAQKNFKYQSKATKVTTEIADSSDGLIDTFIQYFKKAVGFLKTHFDDFIKKQSPGSKLGKVTSVLDNVLTKLSKSNILRIGKEALEPVLKGIAGAITKTAAAAVSFLASDLAMGLTGGLLGACNAENIFQADFDNLDFGTKAKLRSIAALFKGILATSWGGWIDLGDAILQIITGTSFVTELAVALFTVISSDEQATALKNARDDFKNEYLEYAAQEYQAYVQNAIKNGEQYLSEEDFRASDLATSFDEYNADQHKTVGNKIWSGITNFGKNAKELGTKVVTGMFDVATTNFNNTQDAYSKIDGITSIFSSKFWSNEDADTSTIGGTFGNILFYANRILGLPQYAIYGLGKTAINGIKTLATGLFNVTTTNFNNTQDAYSKIDGITSIFSSKFWSNEGADTSTLGGTFGNILFYANRIMSLPQYAIYGLGKTVVKGVKSLAKGVINVTTSNFNNTQDAYSKIDGITSIFSSRFWNSQRTDTSTIGGTFGNILFYGNRILGLPQYAIYGLGKTVVKGVKSLATGVINVVTTDFNNTQDAYSKIDGITSIFSSKFWSNENADTSTIGGTFGNILFYGNRILGLPQYAIYGLGKTVVKGVKSLATGVINVATTNFNNSQDAYSKIDGITSIFSSKFWSNEGADTSTIGGTFGNILFYANRILGLPQYAIYGAGKTVVGGFQTLASGFSSMVSNLVDFADVDDVAVDDYWKAPSSTGNGLADTLSTVLFYVTRALMAPSYYLIQLGEFIGDKIKDAGYDLARTFGLDGLLGLGSGNGGYGNIAFGGRGESPDTQNGFPYYSQNDPSIKNKPYKLSSNIASNGIPETMGARGCGPTALAMVASKLKGGYGDNQYTPENMARLAESGRYSTNVGTTPNYFTEVGSTLGMNVIPTVGTANNIGAILASGNPVIIQGKSNDIDSPFTSAGHYVVGVGLDNNGNVLINDPMGKNRSKSYPMNKITEGSGLAWGFSNGGHGSLYDTITSGGRGIDANKWISIVRAVKAAIAEQKPGYSQSNWIKITVNGVTLSVRTDCSGLVSACLKYLGVLDKSGNMTSYDFTNRSNYVMKNSGFIGKSWTGWDSLKEGDIISKNGHVEIFAYNKNGKHYVYNCGGNSSVNSANPTLASYSTYTTVWDTGGVVTTSAIAPYSSNSTTTSIDNSSISGKVSALAKAITTPIREFLYGKNATDASLSNSNINNNITNAASQLVYSGINSMNKVGNADIDTSQVPQLMWKMFRDSGYSKAATAGILGNAQRESGFDPTITGDNGRAYGLFQWWDTKGIKNDRLTAIKKYAASLGKSVSDPSVQISFAKNEFEGKIGEKYFNYLLETKYGGINKFKNTNDISYATRAWEDAYEISADNDSNGGNEKRINYAKQWYDKLSGYGNPKGYKQKDDYGFGNYNIDKTIKDYDRRIRDGGGYGGYDDSNLIIMMTDMLHELRGTNSGIDKFNQKEFSRQGDTYVIDSSNKNINMIQKSQSPKPAIKKPSTMINSEIYQVAKGIASGKIVI